MSDMTAFYINGKRYDFGTGSWTEVLESVPLEMGVNQFELRAVSFAGHETVQTVTVTRQGEMPEYVEEGRYWNRYYYDEDGRSWHVYFQEGENPAFVKPSDDSGEVVRNYMLGIIDEALLEGSKDTPDYIEPGENRIHFQNSISLQTLRYIIEKKAERLFVSAVNFVNRDIVPTFRHTALNSLDINFGIVGQHKSTFYEISSFFRSLQK